jgi:hypothetical protein
MAAPPPSRWQADAGALALAGPASNGGGGSLRTTAENGGGAPPAPGCTAEAAHAAWRHVRRVARDEAAAGGAGADLYDLLVNSARETQYSMQPFGVSFSFFFPFD